MNPPHIPPDVDAQLHHIAESCAGTDYRLHLIGWSRFEYIDAVHRRLREKWVNQQARETA